MHKLTAQTIDGNIVFFTRALIIATGATRKNLIVRGAKELQRQGYRFLRHMRCTVIKTIGLQLLAAAIRLLRISFRSPSTPKK